MVTEILRKAKVYDAEAASKAAAEAAARAAAEGAAEVAGKPSPAPPGLNLGFAASAVLPKQQ